MEENENLIAISNSNEIKEAVFQLGSLKSPGLDGYPTKFYQHMWESLGIDITNIVQDFFRHKSSLKRINKSFIILTLKALVISDPLVCVMLSTK